MTFWQGIAREALRTLASFFVIAPLVILADETGWMAGALAGSAVAGIRYLARMEAKDYVREASDERQTTMEDGHS